VLRLWWDWLGCCDRVSKIFLENLLVVTDFDPYFLLFLTEFQVNLLDWKNSESLVVTVS
jgi:hypothetical protein